MASNTSDGRRGPGRPANTWNPARMRKLVRLYTLTSLAKPEIQALLAIDGFKPSTSDIQKKLRSLLPPDYAKDHRSFRPSDVITMNRRLAQMRRCKARKASSMEKSISYSNSRCNIESTQSRHRTAEETSLTNNSEFLACEVHPSAAQVSSTDTEAGYICPKMLMLDGTVPERSVDIQFDVNETTIISPTGLSTINTTSPENDNNLEVKVGQEPLRTSSDSIKSLKRRLTNDYSEAYLRHITSVSHYSRTDSFRSNLSSHSTTFVSIDQSRLSTHQLPDGFFETSVSKAHQDIWDDFINEDSEEVLGSDVCEADATSEGDGRNNYALHGFRCLYPNIAPADRGCCKEPSNSNGKDMCGTCGLTFQHILAICFSRHCLELDLSVIDSYGNTPLHSASAAFCSGDIPKIRSMTRKCNDPSISNSSGETFLHILCGNANQMVHTGDIRGFVGLLESLAILDFPFAHQDHHGRTMLHRFLEHKNAFKHTFHGNNSFFCDVFNVVKPDFIIRDNAGISLLDHLLGLEKTGRKLHLPNFLNIVEEAKSQAHDHELSPLSYKAELSVEVPWKLHLWLDRIRKLGATLWIDTNGDTPLTGMLSHCNASIDSLLLPGLVEKICNAGANIHIRNRAGSTALDIAAQRGFRPVVTSLRKVGAAVHSRNYKGEGILWQATTRRFQAKREGNNRLFAAIWSCQMTLLDASAISHPTEQDEWMLPAAWEEYIRNNVTLS